MRKKRNKEEEEQLWTYAFSTEQLFIGCLQTHVLDPREGDTVS
jgi:hypothetical protein